ncbi:MAG: glycosyl hydrolase [Clostridiales bacterium]|nr:glycosyl hydrolase [Clostridiales bacterium]
MSKSKCILFKEDIPSYITPLFWQHGEDEEILRDEIKQMHENGIGSFIVEARPHPDYLGDKWWHDLDVIIDEAKKRQMKVWLFDDCGFPSGFAAGKIRDNHPQYLKVYLDERHIDVIGPLKGSSFIIKAWLDNEETLVSVVAARRIDSIDSTDSTDSIDGIDIIDEESLIEITVLISDGILYWDVPEGNWRIFILIRTRNGGEEATRNHLNPIETEPVRAFIDYIYEEHYRHYGDEFGETIAGFFYDEPRFGNAPTYEAALGNFNRIAPNIQSGCISKMVLPYSDSLLNHLNKAWQGDFKRYLPCLWYDSGPITAYARYVYMDVVSKLYAENFTGQIGDWCRQHRVKLIGHVIEDNGVHARLGYGTGHFFRAIKGQDYSGLDIVVHQIWPNHTSGKFLTPCGYLDSGFFHWGLTKMASSAGHIDPKKNGITVCEVFGAYGWQEGLKLMKWLTDHICVRGVNFIIPHAFSPKYPDPDCPPHFYARGANPQWRYFNIWSGYANRICHLLTGGRHVAPVAVIYHAEAEWAGKYMPFEKVVKALALKQIDCDVIPIDTIVEMEALKLENGNLIINNEEYRALIIPYSQRLPEEFLEKLVELTENNIHVVFINDYPEDSSRKPINFIPMVESLKKKHYSQTCSLETLTEKLMKLMLFDIELTTCEETLRYYHYEKEREQIFFFTNESIYKAVHTNVRVKADGIPLAYDAMENKVYSVDYCSENGHILIKLDLEPYQSIFILFGDTAIELGSMADKKINVIESGNYLELCVLWDVYKSEAEEYPQFVKTEKINMLGNVSVPGLLPDFSGTLRYENKFKYNNENSSRKVLLDFGEVYETAEVWINRHPVGVRICPPYHFDITDFVIDGENTVRIDVTNTLAKKHGNNILDRAIPQEPFGLIGPIKLIIEK